MFGEIKVFLTKHVKFVVTVLLVFFSKQLQDKKINMYSSEMNLQKKTTLSNVHFQLYNKQLPCQDYKIEIKMKMKTKNLLGFKKCN